LDADAFDPAAYRHFIKNPPPCVGSFTRHHNYIGFSCADPRNPPVAGQPLAGFKSVGGATRQPYNTHFGDKNKSIIAYTNSDGWAGGVADPIVRSPGGGPWPAAHFFSGGPNNAVSTLTSSPANGNLWKYRCLIDKGNAPFTFHASIGASTLQGDTAQVTVTFLDQNLTPLKSVTLGPVAAPALGGVPKLIGKITAGTVPVGTRFFYTQMVFTRAGGANNTYNDGAIAEPSLYLGPYP
jgi:hypothetical protein